MNIMEQCMPNLSQKTINIIFITVFILGLALFLFTKNKDDLAVINLHDAIAKPTEILAQTKYSNITQQDIMKRYSRALMPAIKEYGEVKKLTIINAQTIINGAHRDITDDVIRITLKKVVHEK